MQEVIMSMCSLMMTYSKAMVGRLTDCREMSAKMAMETRAIVNMKALTVESVNSTVIKLRRNKVMVCRQECHRELSVVMDMYMQ